MIISKAALEKKHWTTGKKPFSSKTIIIWYIKVIGKVGGKLGS